jgi:hypothetical protein
VEELEGVEWSGMGQVRKSPTSGCSKVKSFDKGWSRAETGSAVVLDPRKMWDILKAALA